MLIRVLFCCLVFSASAQEDWTYLLADGNLEQFQQLGGQATFRLEEEMLIGISQLGTPNSFLATRRIYGDFVLEFEVWIEQGLNSGVQIRSNSDPDYQEGRVHGYQVEIETSVRRWAGGIYDEARRGWLYPLSMNPSAQTAFRNGEWNHYRIEAIGSTIRTWINGIACANLVDDLTPTGFIAFQVHSIDHAAQAGKEVRWRKVRLLTQHLHAQPAGPAVPETSYLLEQLTEMEKRKGWRLVDLATLTKVDDDLMLPYRLADFDFQVDFMLTEGADGGILYGADSAATASHALEYQLIDDVSHPHAKQGTAGNRTLGSLYDLIAAANLSEVTNPYKRYNGIGQWNTARLVVHDGTITHWLNGMKVLEVDRNSPAFRALVAHSVYADYAAFGQATTGYLLLRPDEGRVQFRNGKIREF